MRLQAPRPLVSPGLVADVGMARPRRMSWGKTPSREWSASPRRRTAKRASASTLRRVYATKDLSLQINERMRADLHAIR